MLRLRSHMLRIPCAMFALSSVLAGSALAAPGESAQLNGTAQVEVLEPAQVQPINDLRFGVILQPDTGGTMTMNVNNTFTTTGGVTGNTNVDQLPEGRGAGSFIVRGDPNRLFVISLPTQIYLYHATANMRVDQFRSNTGWWIWSNVSRMPANGEFDLRVGARLRVNADQREGTYTGTYNVEVLYL